MYFISVIPTVTINICALVSELMFALFGSFEYSKAHDTQCDRLSFKYKIKQENTFDFSLKHTHF